MFAQQLLIPAFALLGVAAAQNTAACASATVTVAAQADFAKYTDCPSLKNLVITAGDAVLDISGPTTISGDIIATNNSVINTLSSTSLTSVGGTFTLDGLTALSTLKFDVLTSVKNIKWSSLPFLQGFLFASSITKASTVLITNTFITSLEGIDLMTVGSIDISNNKGLSDIETQIANISVSLNIAGNSQDLVVSLPNLSWANNMTFRNVASLLTPSLKTVNGSFFLVDNTFQNYTSTNLTTVGNLATSQGSLAFVGNSQLTNVSFANVNSIGGAFQVANNTLVKDISMPKLAQVGGAIDLSGNITTPSAPALKNVVGALNIQSVGQIDCATYWNTLKTKGVVQGKSVCKSTAADATTLDGTSSTTSSGGAKTSSTKGAASSVEISQVVAGASILGGLLSLLL